MIIRLYAGDNDLSYDLVDFCIGSEYYTQKRHGFSLLDNLFKIDVDEDYLRRCDDDEYRRIIDAERASDAKRAHIFGRYGHGNKWGKTDPEYHEIVDEVKRQWDIYCKDNDIRPFPIDVKIQYSVSEKDENGEACYYFTCTSQCIVM